VRLVFRGTRMGLGELTLDAGEDPCPTCRWPHISLDAGEYLFTRRWAPIPLDAGEDLTTHLRRFGMLLVSHWRMVRIRVSHWARLRIPPLAFGPIFHWMPLDPLKMVLLLWMSQARRKKFLLPLTGDRTLVLSQGSHL
jgi:hypothetical protein